MSRSFDFILAGASLIVGILLLTGHGDFFMKGGNAQLRKAKYDETKIGKGLRQTVKKAEAAVNKTSRSEQSVKYGIFSFSEILFL